MGSMRGNNLFFFLNDSSVSAGIFTELKILLETKLKMPRESEPGEGKSRPESLATKGNSVAGTLPNNLRFIYQCMLLSQNYTWKY